MESFMLRGNVPEGVNAGSVHGFYVTHLADSGADGIPDEDVLDGVATITPRVNEMRWPSLEPPRTSVKSDIICPIFEGFIYPPGTTEDTFAETPKGVTLIATDQPLAEPNSVQYSVTIELVGARVNPATKIINIPTDGVIDLATVVSESSIPGTITVVSSEDRIRAEASAATATQKATDAASSATAAATSATNAATSASAAQTARAGAETAAADVAARGQIRYDTVSGRYSNASIQGFFAAKADARVYGVSIPKGMATACTKTGANANIAAPTPATEATAGSDTYPGVSPFSTLEVNGGVESDGTPYVTAIRGDANFRRGGSNGDVWILTPTLYWRMRDTPTTVELEISDSPLAGFTVQPKGLLPSGSKRPYMLYAKYALSIVDGVARSISGQPVAVRNISHSSLIAQCKNATTGYSGKSFADDWYMKVMFLLKYATKDSQSVYAGVTSMSTQYLATVAESNTNQIIVSTSTANLISVGSTISLGTNNPVATNRGAKSTFDVFDMRKVVDKLVVDASNTAVVVEGAAFTVEVGYRLSTMPWATGGCDRVVGDGSPTSPASGREPFVLQGIELALGTYESLGDVILSNLGSGQEVCLLPDSRLAATSVTANYRRTGKYLPNQAAASFIYPTYPANAGGLLIGADAGASTSTGMCDGQYLDAVTTQGTRQWLGLGSLGTGGAAGLWLVYGTGALSNAYWGIGSRLSAIGRSTLEDN